MASLGISVARLRLLRRSRKWFVLLFIFVAATSRNDVAFDVRPRLAVVPLRTIPPSCPRAVVPSCRRPIVQSCSRPIVQPVLPVASVDARWLKVDFEVACTAERDGTYVIARRTK